MKYIQKREPPQSLEEYKRTDGASFADLDKNHTHIKRELKAHLIAEQGGLCCYCGDRITFDSAMIEHFLPKAEGLFPELQLEYSNLLSSCMGGQIERSKHEKYQNKTFPLSCDARKKNRVIKISPTDPECEKYFEFDDQGNIYGTDSDARYAIAVLGLDNKVQVARRKAAIDAYTDLPEETDWQQEIEFLSTPNKDGLYEPYCFAVIYWILHFKLVQ